MQISTITLGVNLEARKRNERFLGLRVNEAFLNMLPWRML